MAGRRQGVARLKLQSGTACGRQLAVDRWHFQHGPIDLIIDVDAAPDVRERAVAICWGRFVDVLATLVAELPQLRRAAAEFPQVSGPVARRMARACAPFAAERFITPMAAVAGAVGDELIGVFEQPGVRRACINNGGDIALFLCAGAAYRVGICSQVEQVVCDGSDRARLDGVFTVRHELPVRGVATSGWRGRSQSLGIADSVTVLAANAAAADAAATLVANAVDCDVPGIVRVPAIDVKDDSDLGSRLVTKDVPLLSQAAIDTALSRGRREAELWQRRGALHAAVLCLQGCIDIVSPINVVQKAVA